MSPILTFGSKLLDHFNQNYMGMNSAPSGPESLEISREQVINNYKKFVEKGITDPAELEPNNPEVIEANNLFDRWQEQQNAKVAGNEDAEKRNNFEKTMLFVDAGFTGHDYLGEVLKEWLSEDILGAPKELENNERVQLRKDMAEAVKKIRNLMK